MKDGAPADRHLQGTTQHLIRCFSSPPETIHQALIGGEFSIGDKTRVTPFFVKRPKYMKGRLQLGNVTDLRQQAAEEKVRYGSKLHPGRETAKVLHNKLGSWLAIFSNLADLGIKCSLTSPVGPLRCLATMISAIPSG